MNAHLAWAQQQLACSLLYPLGPAAANDLQSRAVMRELGRGGILDVHQNETGLAVIMAPGSADRSLIRLGATVRTNPRVVTVGMNVRTLEEAAAVPTPDFFLQALLSWGTGKGFSQAVIDIRQGIQFTVCANVLNVDVRYVGTAGPTVQISASSGYGNPQGSDVALTFTEPSVSLATGVTSAAFRVPAYATRVSWFSDASPTVAPIPAATIQQRGDTVLAGRILTQTASVGSELVAVTNGVDFIRLLNESAATRRYGLLYELHL